MSEEPPKTEDPYVEAVRQKAERMARARAPQQPVWTVLTTAGTVGWQFVLPLMGCTLAGHALGRWLDHDGPTLAGIAIGLALGMWQAWRSLVAGMK